MEGYLSKWLNEGDVDEKKWQYHAFVNWRKIFAIEIAKDLNGLISEDYDLLYLRYVLMLTRPDKEPAMHYISLEEISKADNPYDLISENWIRFIHSVNKEEGNRTIYGYVYEAKIQQLDSK